ncbi:protein FAM200C-like [Clavelina lepadiformis]|uniref:protein FAM200C-like n=1 Tax=Clavelina lepadiformis TaxID=159417 RepID=UPI004042F571
MLFSASLKLNMKRQRLDSSSLIHQENAKSEKASFVLSLLIAKEKEPYTIGDEVILPCIKIMAEHVLDKESAEKMAGLSLSSDKVQRQISLMSDDIKEQVIQQLKEAGLFSIQLDESTEIQCCSQLVAFVRYVHSGDIKEDFLFCETLEESTKSDDVLQKLSEFFEANGLDWGNLCSICTDGASALLGSKSGFVSRVLQKSPNAIPLHCMIHRQGLTTQTLPSELQKTLNTIIKTVEFLKETAHETRLVKDLCQDINATHEILLLYTEVHWLFEGNILQRIFELKQEIRVFLEAQDQQDLLSAWCADGFEIQLAYLVDIFQHIITLNLELQG